MKKGFTLIELLAVIVILAIIALIATPIILGIIEDARKGSIEASANGYIDALEYNSARNELKGEKISDGTYDVTKLEVELDGEKPSSGVVTIKKGKVINATLIINNETIYYNGNTPKVLDDKTENYKEELLNGADPVLKDELVPVIIANDGTVMKANTKVNWYSYENKSWANAVILFDGKSYEVGEEIPEESIKEYYVWVPRYAYKLWNVNGDKEDGAKKPIEIVFGSKAKTTGTNNGDMYVHPAFANFNTEGIWVGKFELSYNEETFTDKTKFLDRNANIEEATNPSEIIIKPNVRCLVGKNFGGFFEFLYNAHRNLNSHMMTNMEWGATAYLTYSEYGRCDGNTCTEVTLNNVNVGYYPTENKLFDTQWIWGGTITGCAADKINGNVVSNKNECVNSYNSSKGYLASTTGNITGIYDMSGGAWEQVMAGLINTDGVLYSGRNAKYNAGFKGIYGCPNCYEGNGILENTDGMGLPDSKYYNLYINKYGSATDNTVDYSEGKLGDATKEVNILNNNNSYQLAKIWYQDYAKFVTPQNPWLLRGGQPSTVEGCGMFAFWSDAGSGASSMTTRAVLAF